MGLAGWEFLESQKGILGIPGIPGIPGFLDMSVKSPLGEGDPRRGPAGQEEEMGIPGIPAGDFLEFLQSQDWYARNPWNSLKPFEKQWNLNFPVRMGGPGWLAGNSWNPSWGLPGIPGIPGIPGFLEILLLSLTVIPLYSPNTDFEKEKS